MCRHSWVWRHTSESVADWCRSTTASMFCFFCILFHFFFSFLPPSGRCTEPAHMSLWCLLLKSLPSPSLSSWVHGWLWTPGNDFKTDCSQSRASARIQSESRGSHAFSLFSFLTVRFFFVECGMYVLSGYVPVDLLFVKRGGMRMTTLADIQADLSVTLLEYSVWASSYCQWPPANYNTKSSDCY